MAEQHEALQQQVAELTAALRGAAPAHPTPRQAETAE
jgi:hypothetical protein